MFRIFPFFSAAFCCFLVFDNIPKNPHVPHVVLIENEENWDDWLCQGWLRVLSEIKNLKRPCLQTLRSSCIIP